jgi:hypothetical protein
VKKEDTAMTESQKKILEMLAKNKISTDEACQLLNVIDSVEGGPENSAKKETGNNPKPRAKYLRVTVTPSEGDSGAKGNLFQDGSFGRVNVRIPMSLIRAGIKLTSLIPPEALDKANRALKEKGINFDVRNIKSEDIEELIEALGDMQIDVEGGKGEKVKVFVE